MLFEKLVQILVHTFHVIFLNFPSNHHFFTLFFFLKVHLKITMKLSNIPTYMYFLILIFKDRKGFKSCFSTMYIYGFRLFRRLMKAFQLGCKSVRDTCIELISTL